MSETYIPLELAAWIFIAVLACAIIAMAAAYVCYRGYRNARRVGMELFDSRAEVIRHRNELQKQLNDERHTNRRNREIIESSRKCKQAEVPNKSHHLL